MKKLMIGLVVVVVLIGGGVFFLASNLNDIAKSVIESEGTRVIGSAVEVGAVDIDLVNGTASIRNFSIANPPGYSNRDMIRFDELSVVLDTSTLRNDVIHINSIVASNPYVLYETMGGTSNLDTVSARFGSAEAEPESETGEETLPVSIGRIDISGIQATLQSDRLPREVNVSLGNIVLEDLQGSPEEVARQVARPLIRQLSQTAATALVNAVAEMVGENLEDRVNEKLDETLGEGIREGLGDLFRGD